MVRLVLAQNGVRKKKKIKSLLTKWTDSVHETSSGSSLEDGEISLEGKKKSVNENYLLVCFAKLTRE